MDCPIRPEHGEIPPGATPAQTLLNLIDHLVTRDREWVEQKIHQTLDDILPKVPS